MYLQFHSMKEPSSKNCDLGSGPVRFFTG